MIKYLRVTSENLVLDFVDIAVDRGEQLFPADAQRLHGELSVAILEYHALLHRLMDLLELLEVSLVGVHSLLVLFKSVQLIFECTLGKQIIHSLELSSIDIEANEQE